MSASLHEFINRHHSIRSVYDMYYRVRDAIYSRYARRSDRTVRHYRERLASLKGSHNGQRCFIMGNGPSLNVTPLEKLAGEIVWGVNRCYLLFDRITWRPAFYIAVDDRVVPDNAKEINHIISALPNTTFFFPLHFRIRRTLRSDSNTYWYHEILLGEEFLPDGYFSTDVVAFVRSVRTVTIAAMQLAVHLGFNPIYLIGCDTSYTVPTSSRYEDRILNSILATRDDDPNHFAPNYFGTGKKYHQPNPDRMIFGYIQAKQICDRLGIQVINATAGGQLEIFPRANFASLFT
jgi:hypothetical protein